MTKIKLRKATLPWLFVGLSCLALLVLHQSTSQLTDRDARYKEEITTKTTTQKLWLAVGLPTVPRLNDEDYLGTTLNALSSSRRKSNVRRHRHFCGERPRRRS